MLNLSYFSFHGLSVGQDHDQALKWLESASKSKTGEKPHGFNIIAMYLAAWMYDTAQGIPLDYQQAFEWYQKVADLGYGDTQLRLAEMYQQG